LRPGSDKVEAGVPVLTTLPDNRVQEHWIIRRDLRTGIYAIVHQPSALALTLHGEGPDVILDEWKDREAQRWELIA
jgi:hypothetical protein